MTTTTIVLHSGAVADVPGSDLSATIVGSPPQWDDADDATYGRAETTTTPQTSSPYAAFDAIPTIAEVQAVRITVRYSTSYPGGTLPGGGDPRVMYYEFWGDYSDPGYVWRQGSDGVGHPDVWNDDLINTFAYTVFPASWMDSTDIATYEPQWRALLESGPLVNFYAGGGGLAGRRHAYATIYEVTLEVDYDSGEIPVPPVARLWPRDDGRGISSAPRIWPPPKANRIIGGYQ